MTPGAERFAARRRGFRTGVVLALWLALSAQTAVAGTLTLTWDRNPEPDVAGYRISFGTQSGNLNKTLDVGNNTSAAVPSLIDGERYFFVVYAYTAGGLVSPPSAEVSGVVLRPESSCTFSVSSSSINIASAGATSALSVTTPSGCAWSAQTSVPWLTVTGGASNIGSGSFTVAVSPKKAAGGRSSHVRVGSQSPISVGVSQSGGNGAPLDLKRWDGDNDGRTDIAVWRPGSGTWFSLLSGNAFSSSTSAQWGSGSSGDIPMGGDYDGDKKADYAVWRPGTGIWYVLRSSTGFSTWSKAWGSGQSGDVPVAADYDGDGRTDLAVWRRNTGTWFVLTSSSNYNSSFSVQWGASGDKPLAGDFDGDGKADIAVWRGSAGMWYILRSSLGYSTSHPFLVSWGGSWVGDVPVIGDFDGDGVTDISVWRAPTGWWYLLQSSSGFASSSMRAINWGSKAAGDVPVVGDYDGDGVSDLGVWRGPTGWWYIKTSTTNFSNYISRQWGSASAHDVVVPR